MYYDRIAFFKLVRLCSIFFFELGRQDTVVVFDFFDGGFLFFCFGIHCVCFEPSVIDGTKCKAIMVLRGRNVLMYIMV